MIHGESYKPIVAEAAKKSADKIYNRIMITHLLMDESEENRVGGAVAQGLYAINCYMGMQWNENQPEDHVRYARNDLMGLVREDLGYDMARHVDSTVHMFDDWGLQMMRNSET